MTAPPVTPGTLRALIEKYSVAGPRYTSYPTAPQWNDVGEDKYREALRAGYLAEGDALALYVHIPFCEKLCYYCGCNIQITKDHGRSPSYVDALIKEAGAVAALLGGRKTLNQISWGGGTPTFLNIDEMERLHRGITACFDIFPSAEVSIEVDPRVTSSGQLESLRKLGFNRVSMGVQDFEPQVQKAINREQSRQMTEAMLRRCRDLGYTGINFDLIYGLPHQSLASFENTITQVATVRPDRIALYNYARIPSLLKHQTILEEYPMPSAEERVEIFSMAFERLTSAGYRAIGMDHFALEDDELYRAIEEGTLYRNFMGYSVKRGKHMIGLGASAIGEIGPTFFQNLRKPQDYQGAVESGKLAAFRGCFLSPDDIRRKWVIQEIMCRFHLDYATFDAQFGGRFETYFVDEIPRLAPFFSDGILVAGERSIRVTALGRIFIRNVAMVFDAYLRQPGKASHSKTV